MASQTGHVTIAVQGCAHGALDNIYATIQHMRHTRGVPIDLLICCGDFQSVRNESDLKCMAVPDKYRTMNSFWKYYKGDEVAPVPTLFIGGNHEASNYLWDLALGGFVAPRMFYLGNAGVVNFRGLRIGGLSGIYKDHDYNRGHFERAPYDRSSMRSVYHIREYDVRKLLSLSGNIDVFLTHDWPRGVERYGATQALLQKKPFFREEVETNSLGSPPAETILNTLQPSYWFSAHLHVKYAAVVPHPPGIQVPGLKHSKPGGGGRPLVHQGSSKSTKFLALDKCLPGRDFLQVVKIPVSEAAAAEAKGDGFAFDKEWLAITRAYAPYFPLSRSPAHYPPEGIDIEPHRKWISEACKKRGGNAILDTSFCTTAPPYSPSSRAPPVSGQTINPQTTELLQLLGLPGDLLHGSSARGITFDENGQVTETAGSQGGAGDRLAATRQGLQGAAIPTRAQDPNEIDLGDEEEDDEGGKEEDEEGANACACGAEPADPDTVGEGDDADDDVISNDDNVHDGHDETEEGTALQVDSSAPEGVEKDEETKKVTDIGTCASVMTTQDGSSNFPAKDDSTLKGQEVSVHEDTEASTGEWNRQVAIEEDEDD